MLIAASIIIQMSWIVNKSRTTFLVKKWCGIKKPPFPPKTTVNDSFKELLFG